MGLSSCKGITLLHKLQAVRRHSPVLLDRAPRQIQTYAII
ncbi:hypothetical protein MCEREM30_01906 [Paracoccaceae bacterium]